MSLRIGLYDFFAYTVPGVLYILVAVYGASLFGFLPPPLHVVNSLSIVSFFVLIGAGYIVTMLLDATAYRWGRLFRGSNRSGAIQAHQVFATRHPWLTMRFKAGDWPLLLQSLKLTSLDVATDIEQLNAASIMLRNISLALLFLALIFLAYFAAVSPVFWNLVFAGLALAGSIFAIFQSTKRRDWFYIGIFTAIAARDMQQSPWTADQRKSDDTQ